MSSAYVKEARHTPGPWTQCGRVVVTTADTHGYATWLANCSVGGNCGHEMEANARLIAAAPEMLEALRELLEFGVDEWDASKHSNAVEKARAAIAKATQS